MLSRLYQTYIYFVNHSFGNLSELSDLFSVERKTIMRWVKKLRESKLIEIERTKYGYKVLSTKPWDENVVNEVKPQEIHYKAMKEEFFAWKERVLNLGRSISVEEVTKQFGITEITAKRWLNSDRFQYATLNGSHKNNVRKAIEKRKSRVSKPSNARGMKFAIEGLEAMVGQKSISGGHAERGAVKSPISAIAKKPHAVKSPIALGGAPKSPIAASGSVAKSPIAAIAKKSHTVKSPIVEGEGYIYARAREVNNIFTRNMVVDIDRLTKDSAITPAGIGRRTFSSREELPALEGTYMTSGARKAAMWIRQNVDAVEFVSQLGVTLYRPKNSSGEWAGHCPLHDDRHPSFYVNERNGLWYCHACGVGGDVVELVKRMHGLRFGESVRLILSHLSNEAPSDVLHAGAIDREPAREMAQKKPVLLEKRMVNIRKPQAAGFSRGESTKEESPVPKPFTSTSPKSEYAHTTESHEEAKGRGYLATRGIHDETAQEFGITVNEDGNIAIPLYDHEGEKRGILYRMLSGKYRYRQEGGVTLFGVPQAKKLAGEELFVVEGVFDAMSIWQEGFPAVAIMRTGLNDRQVTQIKELFGEKKIVLIPDNDEAGVKAAKENLRLLREAGLDASIKFLPRDFKDANEYLAQKNQKTAQKMA